MKRKICALALALTLALSGCSGMLNREFVSIQLHGQSLSTAEDPTALQAKNYQELVSAILLLVTRHVDSGTVKLYNYKGNPETDLSNACLEVVQKDPLGAYAVDYIKHDLSLIVSYYEASVDISYRLSAEEVRQVVSVTGSGAIKDELRETLRTFSDHLTLRVSYFSEDEDYISGLVAQAYYSVPEAAFGMPEVTMTLYPDSGIQRIVDLELSYPFEPREMAIRQEELLARAESILPSEERYTARQIYDFTQRQIGSDDGRTENTAYAALLGGGAGDEGWALACKLLCDQAGVTCTVVAGTDGEGAPRFWNIVSTEEGSRHVDCIRGRFGLTDEELASLETYQWDDSYPLCRDGSQIEITT